MRWISGAAHEAEIEKLAADATKITADVAFLTPYGARFILGLTEVCAVDLTVSAYMATTRKSALLALLHALRKGGTAAKRLRVRVARQTDQGFHGKVYRFDRDDGGRSWLVGSANLTETGLSGLGDVSLVIDDPDGTSGPQPAYPKRMRFTKWADSTDYTGLEAFLETYVESLYRAGTAEGEEPEVRLAVGIRDANKKEHALVGQLTAAAPAAAQGSADEAAALSGWTVIGRMNQDSWLCLSRKRGNESLHAVTAACRVGDILIRGWAGKAKVDAHEVVGIAIGTFDGLDTAIAFLGKEQTIDKANLRNWRSRTLSPNEVPESLRPAPRAEAW